MAEALFGNRFFFSSTGLRNSKLDEFETTIIGMNITETLNA